MAVVEVTAYRFTGVKEPGEVYRMVACIRMLGDVLPSLMWVVRVPPRPPGRTELLDGLVPLFGPAWR